MLKRTIVFLCIVIPTLVFAKPGFHLHFGMNQTTLRQEGGKSQWSSSLGFGYEFKLSSHFIFGLDGTVLTKKATLENKTWPSSFDIENANLNNGNIKLDRTMFEIHSLIGYRFDMPNNKGYLIPFVGYAHELLLSDASGGIGQTSYLEPSKRDNYPFDYYLIEGNISGHAKSMNLGFYFYYANWGIELRYKRDMSYARISNDIDVSDRFDTFLILFRLHFKKYRSES